MHDGLLALYHKAPPPLRSAMASLRGWHLRGWRYGPETERLVDEAHERERWGTGEWAKWRDTRLDELLHRAATRVPYYSAHWAMRRRRGDRASWSYLENWPMLTKEDLRANPRAFLADDVAPRRMFRETTSGTTGTPVTLWFSRQTVRAWYALFEARWRRWYGVSRRSRWALIGGQLVVAHGTCQPPFWVWNAALTQLYMSSYHLAPRWIPDYIRALEDHRVEYVLGYTSSLYAVALGAREHGIRLPVLKVALTNAEPISLAQRNAIADAFGCPVRETYGMSEIAAAASECSYGGLHFWPETGVLEVFDHDENRPVRPGSAGRFVCTGLMNRDMPLIRYELGDCGSPPRTLTTNCECGRQLPVLDPLEGRQDDVVRTRDGRRVGRLDPVFKADIPIREAQIVQESLTALRVRYVPDGRFTRAHESEIAERLRQRVGDMEIVFESVEQVPRGANGKFRAVVSHVRDAGRRVGAA
jgi:phenylacetate-CoA ligase